MRSDQQLTRSTAQKIPRRCDRRPDHVWVNRKSLQEVGAFGRIGRYAGEFVFMHNLASDSRGNLYVSEVGTGRRVQKFLLTR